ncbi:MAG TPA: efflux RND transporter permease subunit [Fimbriimonadaceae bacterium]|jgi:multidrug efflux pump subunit AcrB
MLNVTKALQKPYTYIVLALLIVLLGTVTAVSTPTDVFPNIDIPVVSVIWSYSGASPDIMEKRIDYYAERSYSSAVNDIEHMESQSMPGMSVIKIFLQPGSRVDAAVAQITATSQSVLKSMPPGLSPPLIIQFNASSVPILQIGVSSPDMDQAHLRDYAQNFVRIQLASVRGSAIPSPYGGVSREIVIDLNQQALQANHLTPMDVASAINLQNLILPSGTAKMADREYTVSLNSSPSAIADLNNIPVKNVNGAMVYVRDVAQVHDGSAVQTNIVDKDGKPSVLLTVLKSGNASTLDVVDQIKALMPKVQATLPKDVQIKIVSDQSVFVRASVNSVIREGAIAAILTALMILLFLGSWRSTLIVAMSIPLSILFSLMCLSAAGQTINVMTLGGLALAIGILVDNAIVSIENIYRNLGMGKTLHRAIIDGAEQIAAPQLVSTLAICIVFLPIMVLSGAAGSLFKPLAMAVVFAMVASYLLSRTFVPVMAAKLIGKEAHLHAHGHEEVDSGKMRHHEHVSNGHHDGTHAQPAPKGDIVWRVHQIFNRQFEKLLDAYRRTIQWGVHHRSTVVIGFCAFFVLSFGLLPFMGEDFFPSVDSGSFRLHVRAPAGTRLEQTHLLFANVEKTISQVIPAKQIDLDIDNIGLVYGGVNVAYNTTGAIGPADGEIMVQLKEGHSPTAGYIANLRQTLARTYPNTTFFFQPADITTQILNFGLPAPIDVQVVGKSKQNYALANQIADKIRLVPGAEDVHVHQVVNDPELHIAIDRDKAQQLGITEKDIANDLLISLSSSGQVMPNFWVDPANGVSYLVAVQTPQYDESNLSQLEKMPLPVSGKYSTQLLSNLGTVTRRVSPQVINHYNIQPTFDIYANVQGRDLGRVASGVQKVLDSFKSKLPHGTNLVMRGQVESMNSSFTGLGLGLLFAIVLVYFLLVVNYQSWVDPFIIISALPGALSGILIILFVTNTTFSVPALMGAIMCVGVATANSILVINFANDRRAEGDDAITAAVTAGCTRLRPVLMTALAMILGMLPMALALGEGGEQNAPLGRAVIGGLCVATVTTLVFVPIVYCLLRKAAPVSVELKLENLPPLPPAAELETAAGPKQS